MSQVCMDEIYCPQLFNFDLAGHTNSSFDYLSNLIFVWE